MNTKIVIDQINGTDGDDIIVVGDYMYVNAGSGDDIVSAGQNSLVLGGSGNDTITVGNYGYAEGGLGDDTFILKSDPYAVNNTARFEGGAGKDRYHIEINQEIFIGELNEANKLSMGIGLRKEDMRISEDKSTIIFVNSATIIHGYRKDDGDIGGGIGGGIGFNILDWFDEIIFADGTSLTNFDDIKPENLAPIVGEPQAQLSVDQDEQLTYTLSNQLFVDPEGEPLTYRISMLDGNPLPSWLSFDPQTLTLSGTPGNYDVGNLQLLLTATDSEGLSAAQSFNLVVNDVNDAPVANGELVAQEAKVGESWQFALPSGSFTDIDKDDYLTYSIKMANGLEVPSWLTIDAETGKIAGIPSQTGTLSLIITATDRAGATAEHYLSTNIKPQYEEGAIIGTNKGEVIVGTARNDIIYGLDGNDRLAGRRGSDTYVFSKGHGQDIINEQGDLSSVSTDTIKFTNVNSGDVKYERSGNHLVMYGYNGTDSITVEHFFIQPTYTIERFEFADKTITYDDFYKNGMTFTSNAKVVTGWAGANIIKGGNIGQAITTYGANDIIYSGDGDNLINTDAGNDVVYSGDGDNLINTDAGNDVVHLGLGSNRVIAGTGNDTIFDGAGNNHLIGGLGSDTYVFSKENGKDLISELGDKRTSATDTIIFQDVTAASVKMARQGYNLFLSGYNGTNSVTVENFFSGQNNTIEKIQFSDMTMTYDGVLWKKSAAVAKNTLSDVAVKTSTEAMSTEQSVSSLINAMASFSPSTEGSIQVADDTYGYLTPIAASSY